MTDNSKPCLVRDPEYETKRDRVAKINNLADRAIEAAEAEIVHGEGFPINSESVYPALVELIDPSTWQNVIQILSYAEPDVSWKKIITLLNRQRTYRSGRVRILYTVYKIGEHLVVRLHDFNVGQTPVPNISTRPQIINEPGKSQMNQSSGSTSSQMGG